MYNNPTLYRFRWYIYRMVKARKNWRITPQLIDRMLKVRKPHQTETDFVEDALYEKLVREEEAARKDGLRSQASAV
jgi:hypothetical protein